MKVETALREVTANWKNLKVNEQCKKTALANLRRWLTGKEFADYQGQIFYLIKNKKFDLLLDSFYQVIPFGTGGRRGPVGIGTNRINPWTIQASAQGHSEYLKKKYGAKVNGGIVLVYDVRVYPETGIYSTDLPNPVKGLTSKDLARYAAEVYASNGIPVYLYPDIRTTPQLSWTIRATKVISGANFSASHNPREDNGKKVFFEDGGQLIPPADQELSDHVNRVKTIKQLPFAAAESKGLIKYFGRAEDEKYLAAVLKFTFNDARDLKIVYSPLHGCGNSSTGEVLRRKGFKVIMDEKTATPDGRFPNVKFNIPNPEVPESFETLKVTGDKVQADLLVSNDPDADRFGLCSREKSGWRYFNGNELGILLAATILEARAKRRELTPQQVIIKTSVTTSLITLLAKHYGVQVIGELLVGFKYIGEEMKKLEAAGRGRDFLLGAEESHGYLVGNYAHDKDASSACGLLCEKAAELKKQGKTLAWYLENIYRRYGYCRDVLKDLIISGAVGREQINQIQRVLRRRPLKKLGERPVIRWKDYWKGLKHLSATDTMSRNVLEFYVEPPAGIQHIKLTLRPSGTQPKTKFYVEVAAKPAQFKTTEAYIKHKQVIDQLADEVIGDLQMEIFKIIKVKVPRRILKISDLLDLNARVKYFEIEKRIIKLGQQKRKHQLSKDQFRLEIAKLLKIFGKDPVEKISPAFEEKAGIPLAKFLG